MIDWHCHILPGIDDGSESVEQSLAMASTLAAAGFTEVYCTPHLIKGCYEADNETVRQGVAELQGQLLRNNIQLKLKPSREYCLDEYLIDYLKDPLPLGDSRMILVEIPPRATAEMVRALLYDIVRSGFKPVIAHPERCDLLEPARRREARRGLMGVIKGMISGGRDRGVEQSDSTGNQLLDYLRDLGCSFQGNLGSFSGFYGSHVQSVAETMRCSGVYDRYGSDLHAPEHAGRVLKASLVK